MVADRLNEMVRVLSERPADGDTPLQPLRVRATRWCRPRCGGTAGPLRCHAGERGVIGLGRTGRRAAAPPAEAEIGMLDVSANALAVLILATMLVIVAAAPRALWGQLSDAMPLLSYPPPIDAVLAPHSRYVFVLPEGLVELDLDALRERLPPASATARTTQGSLTLVTDRLMYRDLNDYRATLTPDWTALAASALPLEAESAEAEVADAARRFDDEGVATTYLVAAEAVESFAPLYWGLRDGRAPIRWTTIGIGQNVVLQRRAEDFERRSRQWQ